MHVQSKKENLKFFHFEVTLKNTIQISPYCISSGHESNIPNVLNVIAKLATSNTCMHIFSIDRLTTVLTPYANSYRNVAYYIQQVQIS